MALLRKVNQALLFLLIVAVCGILYKKARRAAVSSSEAGSRCIVQAAPELTA